MSFDKKLNNTVIAKYLLNSRLVFLLVLAILVLGLLSFFNLQRSLNPEVEIPLVVVTALYPGASPQAVENEVVIPLENELRGASGIDIIYAQAHEGFASLTVQFVSTVTLDEAIDEVRRLAEIASSNFPAEVGSTSVRGLDFENVPVWQFALTPKSGLEVDRASLELIALSLEKDLEKLSLVDRVTVSGVEQKEIQVLMSPNKLSELSLNPQNLSSLVRSSLNTLPAGSVTTGQTDFFVGLDPSITEVDHVRSVPIKINDEVLNLSDIASVMYRSAPYQKRAFLATPSMPASPSVQFDVYKTSPADITQTQHQVAEFLSDWMKPYQDTVNLIELENMAQNINDQFNDLFSNFLVTIMLVFIVLFVFLGIRQAIIASLSIPLTFLVSFIVMNVTGQSLNFLSVFSLLLALGLLVDDAIVVVEALTAYYRTGKFNPSETGLLVWRDYIVPIWTTTLTTVWAFLPLLLATGIIGEFIKSIPIVVSATLIASTSVAVLITLPLTIILTKASADVITKRSRYKFGKYSFLKKYAKGLVQFDWLQNLYRTQMERILESRRAQYKLVALVVLLSVFSYALVPLGFVQNEFFPQTDSDVMYVGLTLPVGSSLYQTEAAVLEVLEELRMIPEINTAQAVIGASSRPSMGFGESQPQTNTARITARLIDQDQRGVSSHQLASSVREVFAGYDIANVEVTVPSAGPPAGDDIVLKIKGAELAELHRIADQVEEFLREREEVVGIDRSIKNAVSKILFIPDQTRLAEAGLTNQEVGFWLRTSLSGFELATISLDDTGDRTPIILRFSTNPLSPQDVGAVPVLTQVGIVPLNGFGSLELAANPSVIMREDGQRTLTVSASVLAGYSVSQANQELLAYADSIPLPNGYSFDTGGINEENQRSVASILQAMVIAVLLIIATMVVQLGSFRQALMVVLVIPLAVTGVFIVFALTNTALSFPALIGILALFGIVVNNSIMLVDKINQNIAINMQQVTAIVDAATNRLKPIFLSSLTTIVGLVPITITDPIWRGLGGGIISGLFLSGAIMLVFIPVVYNLWYPVGNKKD